MLQEIVSWAHDNTNKRKDLSGMMGLTSLLLKGPLLIHSLKNSQLSSLVNANEVMVVNGYGCVSASCANSRSKRSLSSASSLSSARSSCCILVNACSKVLGILSSRPKALGLFSTWPNAIYTSFTLQFIIPPQP